MKALLSFLLSAFLLPAYAQEPHYPEKGNLVELTVLSPTGSSADISARVFADSFARTLGIAVVVVNRPGAGGAIGYRHVAAQKPDGYSIVWASNSISTTYHAGQLGFDYHAFTPVARVLVESPLLVVPRDAKWKTLAELIRDAKVRPGIITVANSGSGSHTHIASVALFKAAGVEVSDLPYGAAQVLPNVLGGHVDAAVQMPSALSSHLRSGAVRALAVLTPGRDRALPKIPTAREQGVEVALEAWRGVAAPKGTSIGVVAVLEYAIRAVVESPEFRRAAEKYAVRPAFMTGVELETLIEKEDVELASLMQVIGLRKTPAQ